MGGNGACVICLELSQGSYVYKLLPALPALWWYFLQVAMLEELADAPIPSIIYLGIQNQCKLCWYKWLCPWVHRICQVEALKITSCLGKYGPLCSGQSDSYNSTVIT